MVAVRQVALVGDESALEACSRRCAIQIGDLYLLFTFDALRNNACVRVRVEVMLTIHSVQQSVGRGRMRQTVTTAVHLCCLTLQLIVMSTGRLID